MRTAAIAVALLAAPALAQMPPSPARLAEAAQPVRVVCIAATADAFLRDELFRDRVLRPLAARDADAAALQALVQPLGGMAMVALGSGFVVDAARLHVVSSWQVASGCSGERRLAVIDGDGAEPLLAQRLPERTHTDGQGRPVPLVQALCRDQRDPCAADLPPVDGARPLPEAQRRRQLDNLLAYGPDLAVLRLQTPARAAPLPLAPQQQVDDQMRLVIRGFAEGAQPVSVAATYTGPQQIDHRPPGGQPEDEVHARLHRLDTLLQPGLPGAPVLRGGGVVGVLTGLTSPVRGAGPTGAAYAVPATVLVGFLDLLKVPYTQPAPESPPSATAVPLPPVDDSRQRLVLATAAALAVLAAGAFGLLWWRHQRRPAGAAMPTIAQPPRTLQAVNATLLHAVAMPTAEVTRRTSAVDPVRLSCSLGPLEPSVFALPMPNGGTTLFVGRDPQACQVVFPAGMDHVSAVHACFIWNPVDGSVSLRDLSSSGTWLNGQRIASGSTVALAAGDVVELGGPDINRFTVDITALEAL